MTTFGPTYDPALDETRIHQQMQRIYLVVRDGRWRTLGELEDLTDDPQSSISAQLRHLRKPRFGGYVVEKRRRNLTGGTWEYRLINHEAQPGVHHCRRPLVGLTRGVGYVRKRCEVCGEIFDYQTSPGE